MLGRMRVGVGELAVLLAIVAVTGTSSQAGLVVTSRESSLAASGQVTGDQFNLTDSSTSLGSYENTIGDSLPGAGGGTTSASASQRANVTADALPDDLFGSASAQVAELDAIAAQASSLLNIAFDVVDETEDLTIQAHLASSFSGEARVTLLIGNQVIFDRFPDPGDADGIDFEEVLTLEPGSYALVAEARASGTPSPESAQFEVSLSAASLPPAVIPLPAPLLGGAVMLLLTSRLGRRSLV